MTVAYPVRHATSSLSADVLRPFAAAGLFVETGTNMGHGIAAALAAGFTRVLSVEADPKLAAEARKRFAGDLRVAIWLGDSAEMLRQVAPRLCSPCVFYLDAHSLERNPLLEELEAIRLSPARGHVVMVDDVRMFGTADWHGITREQAVERLLAIDPLYEFGYRDTPNAPADLMVATRRPS